MPIVFLSFHFLLLSSLAALLIARVLNVNESIFQFKGGTGSAFCFGLTYSFLSYLALIAVGMSGFIGEDGLSTAQKWILNIGWVAGSTLFVNLYAYIRPETLVIRERMVTLFIGIALFLALVVATLCVGFLL